MIFNGGEKNEGFEGCSELLFQSFELHREQVECFAELTEPFPVSELC